MRGTKEMDDLTVLVVYADTTDLAFTRLGPPEPACCATWRLTCLVPGHRLAAPMNDQEVLLATHPFGSTIPLA